MHQSNYCFTYYPDAIAKQTGAKNIADIAKIHKRLKEEEKEGALTRFDVNYNGYSKAFFYVERRGNRKFFYPAQKKSRNNK